MIKTFSFIIIAILGFQYSSSVTVKAITYNIRLATTADRENQWDNRKEEVAAFLLDQHADFIGIQEALWEQVEFLAGRLGEYEYIGVGRDDGNEKGEAMLIFYKKDKWKLDGDRTLWLSDTPKKVSKGWDAACNRTLTQGVFEHKSGKRLAVWNTHFDHVGQKARRNSVDLILEQAANKTMEIPIILMGDFNLTPDTDLYSQLNSVFTDSALSSTHKKSLHEGTYNGFDIESKCARRIDYIFYNGETVKATNYHVPAPKTNKNLHLSDHLPVITEFELK